MSDLGRAVSIMVQGTASNVGKTLLVAGLCRIIAQNGYSVAPFKARNIALNSGVTPSGEEMARGQMVQAEAAGIVPEAVMNPVLVKAQPDAPPQYVVKGVVASPQELAQYLKDGFWGVVKSSFDELRSRFDVVVIEGMGSPAELGFMGQDIANSRMSVYARASTFLAADISNGGVWASLEGTVSILRRHNRDAAGLLRGLIINKAERRYISESALNELSTVTGLPVFGVIPEIKGHGIPDEDIVGFEKKSVYKKGSVLDVAVIKTPSLQNTDDVDPLVAEPGVQVRIVSSYADFGNPDIVLLGGSKGVVADLQWVRKQGLEGLIEQHVSNGKAVIGICGGYQMLGESIKDPYGIESGLKEVKGLGLLPVETVFERTKITKQVSGSITANKGILKGLKGSPVAGYEIHMGKTRRRGGVTFAMVERGGDSQAVSDGTLSHNGLVFGSYIHGLLQNDTFRRGLLDWVAECKGVTLPNESPMSFRPNYDLLADAMRANINMPLLDKILKDRS